MTALATAARVATLAVVLTAAAAFGLIVGNVLQGGGTTDGTAIGNFVPNNPGGTIAAPATAGWVDYGIRHAPEREEYRDLGLRMLDAAAAPTGAGAADGGARPD